MRIKPQRPGSLSDFSGQVGMDYSKLGLIHDVTIMSASFFWNVVVQRRLWIRASKHVLGFLENIFNTKNHEKRVFFRGSEVGT